MQSFGMRRVLTILLLAAHAHSAVKDFGITSNKPESIASRAVHRIIFEVHRRALSTLHFIQNQTQLDDILSGVVDQIHASLAYTVEDMGQIQVSTGRRHHRWFNVVFINGEMEFAIFEKKLNATHFNPRGFYVIVVKPVLSTAEREHLSRRVLKSFFELFYDNVITLFRDENETTVFMYTCMPCDGTHACYEVIPILYNTFDGERFANQIWHFPKKWNNLNGCSVSLALHDFPPHVLLAKNDHGPVVKGGLDVKILQMIATHLNFTIEYKLPKRVFPNGTVIGVFEMLTSGEANMIAGGFTQIKGRSHLISPSRQYFQTEFVYALPVSPEVGSLERHLFPLKKEIWIIYFSIHCGAFVFLSILKIFGSQAYSFIVGDHTHSPFLDMFQMFFGASFYRTPRYTFARSMFGIWLLATFILSSTYRSRLVEILTSRSPKSVPHTIEEFDAMKFDIHVRPTLMNYMTFLYGNDTRIKVETEPLWNYFVELQIPSGRHRAVMESLVIVNYFNAHHYKDGVLPIVPQRLQHVYLNILFQKNSYFVPAFDSVLRHFTSSGLINKWTQEVVNISSGRRLRGTPRPKTLNLYHFEGTFQLHAMIITISLVMFAFELMSLRWNRLRRVMDFYTE